MFPKRKQKDRLGMSTEGFASMFSLGGVGFRVFGYFCPTLSNLMACYGLQCNRTNLEIELCCSIWPAVGKRKRNCDADGHPHCVTHWAASSWWGVGSPLVDQTKKNWNSQKWRKKHWCQTSESAAETEFQVSATSWEVRRKWVKIDLKLFLQPKFLQTSRRTFWVCIFVSVSKTT